MGQNSINLEQLYRGYVLSFSSLGLQVSKNDRNRPLFTHQVISYWAQVGLSLGYYPWAEEEKRDLGWHDEKQDKYLLHLESENDSKRIPDTLKKLKKSSEEYRIGILFVGEQDTLDKNSLQKQLEKSFKNAQTLIITTWWGKKEKNSDSSEWSYLVTGHYVKDGKVKLLQEALLIWHQYGTLKMIFPDEPNW